MQIHRGAECTVAILGFQRETSRIQYFLPVERRTEADTARISRNFAVLLRIN